MTDNSENALEISTSASGDLASSCQIALNDSRTREKIGTRLTQNRSTGVLGWTYFVRVDDAIKIGAATNPKDRLSALQTAHEKPLDVLAVVPAAMVDEYKAHQLFAHLRIRGEWFKADRELLYFIEQAKAEAVIPPKPKPKMKIAKSLPPPMTVFERIRRPLYQLRDGRKANDPIAHACHNLIEMSKNLESADSDEQKANLKKSMGREVQRLERLRAA